MRRPAGIEPSVSCTAAGAVRAASRPALPVRSFGGLFFMAYAYGRYPVCGRLARAARPGAC